MQRTQWTQGGGGGVAKMSKVSDIFKFIYIDASDTDLTQTPTYRQETKYQIQNNRPTLPLK